MLNGRYFSMAPKYQMVADTLRSDILDGVYQ